MANPNHDQRGRFASGSAGGAATGDHQAVSPSLDTRNVDGKAIPRSQPITQHATPSVGTEKPIRLDSATSPSRKAGLGSARQDRIAAMRATDARHYGIPGDEHARMDAVTLNRPKASITSSPGRFDARGMKVR